MIKVLLRIVLPLTLLAACGPLPANLPATPTALVVLATPSSGTTLPTATSTPTPEIVSPTPDASRFTPTQPSPTPEPSSTPRMVLTDTPRPLPTLSLPTTDVTDVPQPDADSAAIQILAPGPLSKVASPLRMRGYVIPGTSGKVRFELYGEDGRLLFRQIQILTTELKWAYFSVEVPFEVHAAGELGRLSVSTQDEYGRTTALYAVHVLLLAEGDDQVNPPGNLKERCVIEAPAPGGRGSGGNLKVSGGMRPLNNLPLVVELVARDGGVLSSRLISVVPAADDSYVPFTIDVPYTIPNAMYALLVVRQADDRIGGGMYLYSQEVLLNP